MIDEIMSDAESRMKKSIESFKKELAKIRTGRAHTSLLDTITVNYYGNDVPLSQTANIAVSDARTLSVTPWEKNMIQAIEKAIMMSDLGLNPATSGNVIRVPLPPLTEERRRDLTKVVRAEGESAKVAIRNIRRDVLGDFKELQKEKEITEDDERKAADRVQKLTDQYVAKVDDLLKVKEQELMEI
ncbi:MAG: ribosome recycling factor [Gammaproteobacteria bacterium]|nr:ribosome recycling factor [Gammaproteobacteria bacterium]